MSDSHDDWAVVQEVLAGDTDAYAKIIRRYQGMVVAMVAARVPTDQAEEVAHTAFIRVFRALKRYRPSAPFRNWLTTIVLRTCHDFWRKHYRSREVMVSDLSRTAEQWMQSTLAAGSDAEYRELAERQEARETLDQLLDMLSPLDRDIVTCIYLEERSVNETAAMLDISVANVKVRAFRARRKMRRHYNSSMGGDDHA